jgi:hypothetical protein
MAKKFNAAAMKELLFNHGEKVALGTCVFIVLVFAVMGLLRATGAGNATGSSQSWAEEFNKMKTRIVQARDGIQPVEMDDETKAKLRKEQYEWKERQTTFDQNAYVNLFETARDNKRVNPVALSAVNDPNLAKLEYINGAVLVHSYDLAERKVNGLEGTVGGEGMPMPMPMPMPGVKGGAGQVTLPAYAHSVRPTRMVVGTMVYPLKKLVADYTKALRLESQADLFAFPDDLPKFEGFNLVRYEVLSDDELGPSKVIIGIDGSKKVKMADGLKKLLREAVYDERMAMNLEPYLFAGLSMPMPKLANRNYAKPVLEGFDFSYWEEDAVTIKSAPAPKKKLPGKKGSGIALPGGKKIGRPMDPMPPMGDPMGLKAGGVEQVIKPIAYKDLVKGDPNLANRLFAKDFEKEFNPYHVLGFKPPVVPVDPKGMPNMPMPQMPMGRDGMQGGAMSETRFFSAWTVPLPTDEGDPEGAGGTTQPIRPMGTMPGGMGAGGVEFKNWDRDALIRFIDVDVEPGKTYKYAVQVRIANPNYKKPTQVAFTALAKPAELPLHKTTSWAWTGPITIPQEYFFYAADQPLLDDWASDKKPAVPPSKDRDAAPIQVHQWVKIKEDLFQGKKYLIGDWAIAEKLLVRRGEQIGVGTHMELQVPVWSETKDAFEIPRHIKDTRKKKMEPGIRIDLRPVASEKDGLETTLPPPVLVDFTGGKRYRNTGVFEEDSALDALILSPEGKLVVRNSRVDSDVANPEARERHERVLHARQRVADTKESLAPPGGPMTPGMP